jgi:tetratricopeptide (TPR) repeat protein
VSPDDASIVAGLGRALFLGRADFEGAARQYERAVTLNPLAGWYWLQLAHCRTLSRQLSGAREAAERAIDLQERFLSGRQGAQIVGAYMRRGHVAALEERPEAAVHDFQRELAFVGQLDHALRGRIQVELNLRLGMAQRMLGAEDRAQAHLDAALAAFERRAAMGADDPATRYYAAGAFAQKGDHARALAELAVAITGRPKLNAARARNEPEMEPLRGDPELERLTAR